MKRPEITYWPGKAEPPRLEVRFGDVVEWAYTDGEASEIARRLLEQARTKTSGEAPATLDP